MRILGGVYVPVPTNRTKVAHESHLSCSKRGVGRMGARRSTAAARIGAGRELYAPPLPPLPHPPEQGGRQGSASEERGRQKGGGGGNGDTHEEGGNRGAGSERRRVTT